MAKQKNQLSRLIINHEIVNISRLLPQEVDRAQPSIAEDVSNGKIKSEMPLFYNRPIHKAKKHDLL